ncbi:hypothetical protein AAG570_002603 [Ranatra chinensis]|uniref:Uncharacterized protein n=1 Tax=Ranatra chinensis TaxID=642074 RepID=A0ABD0Y828_9HEMI
MAISRNRLGPTNSEQETTDDVVKKWWGGVGVGRGRISSAPRRSSASVFHWPIFALRLQSHQTSPITMSFMYGCLFVATLSVLYFATGHKFTKGWQIARSDFRRLLLLVLVEHVSALGRNLQPEYNSGL